MTAPVIIVGCGGHGRVLLDALLENKVHVAGITDLETSLHGKDVYGVPVIGGDEVIGRYMPSEILLVNGVGSVGDVSLRKRIFEGWKQKGYKFSNVLHPSAVVGRGVVLAEGVQVMAGAVVQAGTSIGENSIINTSASVDHDCVIGMHCHVAPGAVLSGGVTLGDGVHIGLGACVVQGVKIGAGAFVVSGAVVKAEVAEGGRVKGNPTNIKRGSK